MNSKNIGWAERILKHYLLIGLIVTLIFVPVALFLSTTNVLEKYELQGETQNYIAWFGIPYGLIISSVLVKLWGQFEAVEQTLSDEAGATSSLFDTIQVLDVSKTSELQEFKEKSIRFVSSYVNHVIEYHKEETDSIDYQSTGQLLLYGIRKEVLNTLSLHTNHNLPLYLLQQIDRLDFLRKKRLQITKQKMPEAFWFLTVLTSLVWVASIFLDGSLVVRLTGVFVVTVLFAVLRDLDDYFDGALIVNIDDWKKIGL